MTTTGQNYYSYDNPIALPGLIGDIATDREVVSALASVALFPGLLVRVKSGTNTTPPTVELPLDDSGTILGVVAYEDTKQGTYPQGSQPIGIGDVCRVLRKGRIWAYFVSASGSPTQYSGARVVTTNGAGNQGKLTGAAISANAVRDITGMAQYTRTPITANIVGQTGSGLTYSLAQIDCNFAATSQGVTGATGPTGPTGP